MITCFIRTLILYFIIIFSLRIMGKRQLGELQPAELVTSILISDLAAVPMQDLGIPLMQGLLPILTLFSVEFLISALSAKSMRVRTFFTGRTSVLIKGGKINQSELKRQRVNVAELLEELRLKDVFDPRQVSCAYLETNGAVSLQLMPPYRPVTAAQLQVDTANEPGLYTTLIAQGRIITTNLKKIGRDEGWLMEEIQKNKLQGPKDIYLMVLDNLGGVMVVPRESFSVESGVEEV